ncbi:hypothetical protein J7643_12045 [bacterium]|nr:hypothetical protein [bacterium]
MKRIGAVALVLGLAGCGWYTNVPAQISVQSVEPGTVGVVFNGSSPPAFTNPTVTAIGEQGSLGATYTHAAITYFDSSSTPIKELDAKDVFLNLRVAPASLTPYTSDASKERTFTQGTGKTVLPIVNQKVLDYGTSNKPGTLTAQVVLTGLDDAQFGTILKINVPIVFSGL